MTVRARLLGALALVAVILLWAMAATVEWRTQRWALQAGRLDGEAPDRAALPWAGGDAARQWARRLLLVDAGRPEAVSDLLADSLRDRPLYAPSWLDYAEWLKSRGEADAASYYIGMGRALWPGRPSLLWRAAMMQIELGQFERAAAALMDYWTAEPGDGERVLGLARRLLPDAGALAAAAQQVWQTGEAEPRVYQRQLMAAARRSGDLELAEAVWARLEPGVRRQRELLFPYLALLLDKAAYAEAGEVWRQAMRTGPGVYNGGFEQPLLDGGFGWQFRQGQGYVIERRSGRAFDGDYSLRIEFKGTDNVNFHHLSQIMLVEPGRRYRLSGYWSGYELTTRSGVYIECYTVDAEDRSYWRLEPRWGSWTWEPFELAIDVPADGHLLAVRVRRRATDALDRLIGGKLWLDALELTPLNRRPDDVGEG